MRFVPLVRWAAARRRRAKACRGRASATRLAPCAARWNSASVADGTRGLRAAHRAAGAGHHPCRSRRLAHAAAGIVAAVQRIGGCADGDRKIRRRGPAAPSSGGAVERTRARGERADHGAERRDALCHFAPHRRAGARSDRRQQSRAALYPDNRAAIDRAAAPPPRRATGRHALQHRESIRRRYEHAGQRQRAPAALHGAGR